MGLEVTKISDLDIDKVQQNQEQLRALVQEDNPLVRTRRGVFDDLLTYYGGVMGTINQENIDRIKRSQSLNEITADPTLADDDIVDGVLSNFGVTRDSGDSAQGTITIVVSKLASVTVANGAIFTASGKQFNADQAYVARTDSANVQSDSDRVLTPLSDGNYAFTIEVTASEIGTASRLSKDTTIVPESPPLNFVTAFATSDFTGGADLETNAELLARLREGPAVKALSGRVTMQATLRDRDGFENILGTSIIGCGDAEMQRDRHWIWPTSGGGRVDWYVRTQDKSQLLTLTKTATLVSKTNDGKGNWQISIGKSDAPGFYEVYSIKPADDSSVGSFTVVSDTRGFDMTGSGELPDVANAAEAAYSSFQTSVIIFKDDRTATTALTVNTSTQSMEVTLRVMPLIGDIQASIGSRSTVNTSGDVLIKAAIPCFLKISCTINLESGAAVPDTDAIADALADRVNQYGFVGRLPASVLTDVIQGYLTGTASVGTLDLFGRIRRPDGTSKYLRSGEVLIVPDEPDKMVTARTVIFILDPEDVAIATRTVAIPEI